MSRISSDDQLNFLLKCVKHSTNGKVDFSAVADECGIVTKGAAAKRYERMMKANGINPNGGAASPEDESPEKPATTPKKSQKTPTKGKSADDGKSDTPKKRKNGKGAATTPSKKAKAKSDEKVVDSDSGEGKEGDEIHVKKEKGLNSENDPFLTQAPAKMHAEDALFTQFCNTAAASAGNTADQKGRSAGNGSRMLQAQDETA